MTLALEVCQVGKQYARHHPQHPTTLVETIISGLRRHQAAAHYWAFRGVNFSITTGRMVGIIGANGAGKSTLLRLLGGVGRPDEGTIHTHGRIGALFDLGTGFHPDLTGRENVLYQWGYLWFDPREVTRRFDDIVAFAELQEWIDDPLRTYSTGMQLRLAFAIATQIEPDILLIDEVLAVGDIAFQRKCLDRIVAFKEQGCTILLVTQDPSWVARYCDEALWLRDGKVEAQGAAEVIAGQYLAERNAETKRRTPPIAPIIETPSGMSLKVSENRFGSQEMQITGVYLLNRSGEEVEEVANGDSLVIKISYYTSQIIYLPIFGVTILNEDELICFESNVQLTELEIVTRPRIRRSDPSDR